MSTADALSFGLLAVVLVGCGAWLVRGDLDRVLAVLLLAAGAVVGAAAVLTVVGASHRTVVAAVGLLVLLPLALVRASGLPPWHPLTVVASAVCVAGGALAVMLDGGWFSGAGLLAGLAVAACWWVAVELASPEARPRLLWPVAAAVPLLVLLVPVAFLLPEPWTDLGLAALLALVPVAVVAARTATTPLQGSARRAVVEAASYGAAAVLVFSAFAGVAAALGVVVGRDPAPNVLGIVAVCCAAVFEPARRALWGTAEVILYGTRQDPLAAAAVVGAHVAEDPVPALRALVEVLGVPYARLDEEVGEPATASALPPAGAFAEVAHVGAEGAPGERTELALRLGDRTVGRLVVASRRPDGSLSTSDARVVAVVAPALAQTLRARRLAADLRESRGRTLVAAQEERRRVRRDLHDGLGPTLSGIAYTADAASNTIASDPDAARALVDRVRQEARSAVSEVRRIVEGMRPPALDELGLVGALDQRVATLRAADGAPLTVALTASATLGTGRLAAAVEVAAYRIVLEAVTNVARHASSHRAEVVLEDAEGALLVEVRDAPDDGVGRRLRLVPGVGIASMRERAADLDGSLEVTLEGGGVVVRARLPHPVVRPASLVEDAVAPGGTHLSGGGTIGP